jgi:glycosyltransferase involved in cell wall biosynthesis
MGSNLRAPDSTSPEGSTILNRLLEDCRLSFPALGAEGTTSEVASDAGCGRSKLVIITEIIAPYRIPVFNALARRSELDLHVIFLAENDPSVRQWQVYKEEIEFSYQVLPSWRWRLGKHNLLFNRGLRSALTRAKPDALLCGGYNYLACWEAAYWAKAHQVPLLLWSESTAADIRKKYAPIELLKSRFLRSCAGFVVPGIASAKYLKDLGIPEHRIFTAPNAVDTDRFFRLADESRSNQRPLPLELALPPRYFLYVGRLIKAKGVFDLLDAYAQIDEKIRAKVGLVFVGDGHDASELMQRASRINSGNIHFVGFVHRDGLAQFYTRGQALILPTHSDTWGLVVNEAMSCGLPILTTDVAGCVLDLVQNNWNGFVVRPRDAGALARTMTRLAVDECLRQEMSIRSRERIKAYSPAAWAAGIVEAFTATCQRHG